MGPVEWINLFYELNMDPPPHLSVSTLHLTDPLSRFLCILLSVCLCVSRCSATTTSCIWSLWARRMQASTYARLSCPGSAWERLRLHLLSTVSHYPIAPLIIPVLMLDKKCRTELEVRFCSCVEHGRRMIQSSVMCLFNLDSFCTSCKYLHVYDEWSRCMSIVFLSAPFWLIPAQVRANFSALHRSKANISMSNVSLSVRLAIN